MPSAKARPSSVLVASKALFRFEIQGVSGTAGRVGGLSSCSTVCIDFRLSIYCFGRLGSSVSISARALMGCLSSGCLSSVDSAHLGSNAICQLKLLRVWEDVFLGQCLGDCQVRWVFFSSWVQTVFTKWVQSVLAKFCESFLTWFRMERIGNFGFSEKTICFGLRTPWVFRNVNFPYHVWRGGLTENDGLWKLKRIERLQRYGRVSLIKDNLLLASDSWASRTRYNRNSAQQTLHGSTSANRSGGGVSWRTRKFQLKRISRMHDQNPILDRSLSRSQKLKKNVATAD
jgi:hypothetical protein